MDRFIKLESIDNKAVWVDRTKIVWISDEDTEKGNSIIMFVGGLTIKVIGNPDRLIMYKIGYNF